MTDRAAPAADTAASTGYADVWVVLPTYNEIENLRGIAPAILDRLPGATLLVVDDSSPDGTGRLADEMALGDSRVRVLHRASKEGLGKAYIAGFQLALENGAGRVVQMDADWSHHPKYLPTLVGRLEDGAVRRADLAIGSRYVTGGAVRNWGPMRKLVSRGGSLSRGVVSGCAAYPSLP